MNNLNPFVLPRMRRVEHVHFVGIGGVGMCGIAEVLHNEGYTITGSDLGESAVVKNLQALGIKIFLGHQAENINGANVVVRSTAISSDNAEIKAATEQLIPVIPRAAMLAELMRFRYGIAIAGTHGKTTTTSLVSSLLGEGGFDPSYVIGGKLTNSGSNAQLGKSTYFVAEADESDASFLFLKPMMAVVTNIDADHMSTYGGNFDKLRNTFIEFLHHLPFYGLAVLCIEDPEIRKILPAIQRPTATYGFHENALYRAIDWRQNGLNSEFIVQRPAPHAQLTIQFPIPGKHNVLNALAAIAIATEVGVDDRSIVQGLLNFQGVKRRFQMLGERTFNENKVLIVDDYGHHPQEITSTIDAFREVWSDKRLIHIFQPHRFTRTQELFDQFVHALSQADELILLDIYAAGEKPIDGISSQSLLHEINKNFSNACLVNEATLENHLNSIIKDGDVILMQGAGSISQIAHSLIQAKQVAA